MAQDETEFDKLLKETREWEARDRARHKSSMMEDGAEASFPAASRAPMVTIEELEKKTAVGLEPTRDAQAQAKAQAQARVQTPKVEVPRAAATIKAAIETAMKQAQVLRTTDRGKAAPRAKGKGGWSWIWWLVALYFIFRHYLR